MTRAGPGFAAARLLAATALLVLGACRSASTPAPSAPKTARLPTPAHEKALGHLCGDVATEACMAACPPALPVRAHAECLIEYRFSGDAKALRLARSLYAKTGALPGVDVTARQGSYGGATVSARPALPIGDDRRHLEWILSSFERYEEVFAAIRAHADRPIEFRLTPDAFQFFQTEEVMYPSAWGARGIVGYNLRGPLHTSERDVLETLFHLNDEWRGGWSAQALNDIFTTIGERCRLDHECFGSFAPHDTVVPNGTYYPFDERTRDVREYAAELALRFYREHEAVLQGTPLEPPFKCLSEENRVAWARLSEDFFAGVDLTRDCDTSMEGDGS